MDSNELIKEIYSDTVNYNVKWNHNKEEDNYNLLSNVKGYPPMSLKYHYSKSVIILNGEKLIYEGLENDVVFMLLKAIKRNIEFNHTYWGV